MNCLSNIIGRQVINVKIAQSLGTVYNIRMDKRLTRARSLEILTEDDVGDTIYALPVRHFKCTPFEVMLLRVKREEMREKEVHMLDTVCCPIGKKCFNTEGQYIGHIKDIIFDAKLVTKSIVIDDCVYTSFDVMFASDELVILKGSAPANEQRKEDSSCETRISSSLYDTLYKGKGGDMENVENENYFEEEGSENMENNDLTTEGGIENMEYGINDTNINDKYLEDGEITEKEPSAEWEEIIDFSAAQPANIAKVVGNPEILEGKTLTQNLYAYNGVLIAEFGASVTKQTIKDCAKNGKLIELIKSCR